MELPVLPVARFRVRDRAAPGAIGGLVGVLGGASLIVRFGGGLYLSAIGTLILIWVVIWNAFSMMIASYTEGPQN
jgi:hypothetical protein